MSSETPPSDSSRSANPHQGSTVSGALSSNNIPILPPIFTTAGPIEPLMSGQQPSSSHSAGDAAKQHGQSVYEDEDQETIGATTPRGQGQSLPGQQNSYEFDFGGDDGVGDGDSAYDEESLLGDDTRSLASYITNYRFENGRRYHAYRDGAYWGPNDEHASDTQDLAHHIYLLTFDGKLHLAPIKNPQNILDLGTGTGIWAVDMADAFPSSSVLGVDLSPIQPSFVPPNCTFEIDDVTLEWTYPPNSFDFIHIRELFGSIPDWDYFFSQCFTACRSGGWVEIAEHSVCPVASDGTQPPEHFYHEWGRTVVDMGLRNGKSFTIWEEAKERMEAAGFVDVVEIRYEWPMNGWPRTKKAKEIGRWNQLRLHNGIEGFMLRLLTVVGGWTYSKAQVFLAEMRKNLKEYTAHSYLPGTIVYGRKP